MRHYLIIGVASILATGVGCTTHSGGRPVPTSIGLGGAFPPDKPAVPVIFELRYYLVGYCTEETAPRGLQIVRRNSSHLICAIDEPLKLLKQPDEKFVTQIGGFVFQIVEPREFAGQVLTAHFDGIAASGDPFRAFEFGKRYKADVAPRHIGNLHFVGCF